MYDSFQRVESNQDSEFHPSGSMLSLIMKFVERRHAHSLSLYRLRRADGEARPQQRAHATAGKADAGAKDRIGSDDGRLSPGVLRSPENECNPNPCHEKQS